MLEKSMYDSWASRIRLFIKGKKNGRMMLDLIDEGPLVYLTVVGEDGHTRTKKYSKLTEAQQLQDDCDVQATNIILHDLPPDVYSLFNHQQAAKDIWDIVKLLMKGTDLSYQEHKCRLYNLFDNKFVTDVKLAKSLYTTKYDQMYAYLSQHEQHANEQGEDPIDCINKAMAFLSAVASRFQSSNNQLRTSSNPRNQATIQDGRVTVQQVQGIKSQSFAGIGNRGIATTSRGNYTPAEAQEAGQILDEEQLAFIADPGIAEVQVAHCDSDVRSEVPYSDTYPNDMINQDVQ
ncbi:hypothetical protein Tco_1106641 [Tanacetum coccineum]